MDLLKTSTAKDRTSNFNKDEATKLTLLLRDYPIITSKRTDHASNQQKEAAWRCLVEKFNIDSVVYRSVKQLQQKFNNMKKVARKEMSEEKRSRRLTGGGPPPPKPSETTEWLNSVMGESISGLPAVYDSDALVSLDSAVHEDTIIQIDILEDKLGDDEEVTGQKFELRDFKIPCSDLETKKETTEENCFVYDSSTPKALLRKPISKQLCGDFKKKKTYTPMETRKRIIKHFDNKIDLNSKKCAREEQLMKYAQEEHLQNLDLIRKKHDKTIQFLEEKHSLYIKQQQEIHTLEIDLKKKMHNLMIEKAKLEIEKLKNVL